MNAARRSKRRRDWPRGLYESRPGYFVWRHPEGHSLAVGRVPLAVAINEAQGANAKMAAEKPGLLDRLEGRTHTVAQLLEKMDVPANKNTLKATRSLDKKILSALGSRRVAELSVLDCAGLVDGEAATGKARSAQALRSRLIAVCSRGVQLGWAETNPASPTANPKATTKRGRLTLDGFRRIYAVADQVNEWLPLAMRLGVVTGADRSTIAGLQRSMRSADMLTYQRGKTGALVAVPLRLRLDAMGWTLAEVLDHKTGVLSPWYVHHVKPHSNATPGSRVFPDRISKAFTEARKLAGLPDTNAPTFHELRSLAKRLYDAQRNVDTKALLGHKTEKMSDLYGDARGVEAKVVHVG